MCNLGTLLGVCLFQGLQNESGSQLHFNRPSVGVHTQEGVLVFRY